MEWIGPDGYMGTLDEAARDYINAVRDKFKPKTVNRKMTALRSYGRHHDCDLLRGYRAPTPMRATPHPLPEGREGVMRMLGAARDPRQAALVAFGGLVGLRLSESRSVEPFDFIKQDNEMNLRVRGKGDKERMVPVSKLAWNHLSAAVLEAMMNKTKVVPLSDRRARQVITDCGRWAGLSRPVASHDLRATFATEAYERTRDLRVVQELLGHSSSETTEGYVLASRRRMREAVEA